MKLKIYIITQGKGPRIHQINLNTYKPKECKTIMRGKLNKNKNTVYKENWSLIILKIKNYKQISRYRRRDNMNFFPLNLIVGSTYQIIWKYYRSRG